MDFRSWLRAEGVTDNPMFSFFFKKDGQVYGAPEESRVVFARIKTGDKEMSGKWKSDASFTGMNLNKVLAGDESPQAVFDGKAVDKIKVVSPEQVEKLLAKHK